MQKTIHSDAYRMLILWIKSARTQRRLSMRELAGRLGVSHTWVGKIEQHERRLDVCEFVRLCDALELDPHAGLDLLSPAPYGLARRKRPPLAADRGPSAPSSPKQTPF